MARFDRAIPPGGEGKIVLKVDTKRFKGSINKTARVYTNDPGNKIVKISLSAFVKVSISVSPKSVYLGGFAGDTIERAAAVRAQSPARLSLKPVDFSLSGKVDYRIETLEKGRHYRIVFKNKCAEEGRYKGFLRLQTNYPDKPEVTIRITGNIRKRQPFTN